MDEKVTKFPVHHSTGGTANFDAGEELYPIRIH